jgi:hypothetical protein
MKELHIVNPLQAVANIGSSNRVACHLHDSFPKIAGPNVWTENLTNRDTVSKWEWEHHPKNLNLM